ncbi:MAG: ABC transporter substrate-binding protein [Actinomycetota bacterium]|nr:ABC transporter substrate-binding protein [Actinomycetota bacterium]
MRKVLVLALLAGVLAAVAAGCGGGDDGEETGAAGTTTATAASTCAKDQLEVVNAGQLTVGTDNPAFPPWFEGGTQQGSRWEVNDPTTGQGYESAVTYAVARELGFTRRDVRWIVVPFAQTYKPGPKNFDLAIEQISYSPQRAKAVDFSESYYDVNQALVALAGTAIARARTRDDLKQYKLGAVIGTTSYRYIVDNIEPTEDPSVYDTLNDNISALNNRQIDGLVTDFPTSYYIANVQLENGTIVGRFPTVGQQEYFGMVFEKGSSLVECVNEALQTLKQNGDLARLEQRWITRKASAPVLR